jgi:hypothetical protein
MQKKILNSLNPAPKTSPFDWTYTDVEGDKFAIEIKYNMVNGRAVPITLIVTSVNPEVELTQAVLRRLPFRSYALKSRDNKPISQKAKDMRERHKLSAIRREQGTRGKNWLTEQEVEQTISAFYGAYQTGQPIVKQVAWKLDIPISTANKRIMKLRREGLLPPGRQRRVK